jgi:hypothetical protein
MVRIHLPPARSLLRTCLSGATPIDNRRGFDPHWTLYEEFSVGRQDEFMPRHCTRPPATAFTERDGVLSGDAVTWPPPHADRERGVRRPPALQRGPGTRLRGEHCRNAKAEGIENKPRLPRGVPAAPLPRAARQLLRRKKVEGGNQPYAIALKSRGLMGAGGIVGNLALASGRTHSQLLHRHHGA